MKSKAKRIPETVTYGNTQSTDLTSKVELFGKFFQSIYSKSSLDVNLSSPDVVNPYLLLNVTTSASEVQEAPGVDNLPARILRACAYELSVPLTHLFNSSLKSFNSSLKSFNSSLKSFNSLLKSFNSSLKSGVMPVL